eukprot:CAMPEP_0170256004 /NCGR_PEP_ID=MMETSP0116_2-20130129/27855_1 /TAXON_ID=400756 /ORGANISM="Durinskia baltica, Strain CSIRO CS-38" /LENGTH=546 /DNA_ID=CAMNT_0010507013 /DNA_START=75 /DNA_END=1711 /DNA_ORIENTATION=-
MSAPPLTRAHSTAHVPTRAEVLRHLETKGGSSHHKHNDWGALRKRADSIINSPQFDGSLALLIAINVVLVIIETNNAAQGVQDPTWLITASTVVMTIYLLELLLRIYVHRAQVLTDKYALIDAIVITVDILTNVFIDMIGDDFPVPVVLLRIARVLKITRAVRLMALFPELHLMLRGMVFAAKSILWGVVMLLVLLSFWSILAVMFIHPVSQEMTEHGIWARADCDRCPRAFESVQLSMLTLCQTLVAGDSWGMATLPIIEYNPMTALFFIPSLITVSLAVLNLILAVIVERANEAKVVTERDEAEKKDKAFLTASERLYEICVELDGDNSGCLTYEELLEGFKTHQEFAALLRAMDIEQDDLEVVFSVLDQDGSGDVQYTEFVQQLHMMKNHEAHTLLVFIKYYVMEIRQQVHRALGVGHAGMRGSAGHGSLRSEQSKRSSVIPHKSTTARQADNIATPTWPELELELENLRRIREDIVSFSGEQASRLDGLHEQVLARFRSACHPDIASETAGDRGVDAMAGYREQPEVSIDDIISGVDWVGGR